MSVTNGHLRGMISKESSCCLCNAGTVTFAQRPKRNADAGMCQGTFLFICETCTNRNEKYVENRKKQKMDCTLIISVIY